MTANEQDSGDLSLEQVENHVWGEAPGDATRLMAIVHRLRRKPIKHLTAVDLRTLLSQRVGLAVLVARVLPHLERDPYLEADYYPGDLLVAVLRVPTAHWQKHPQQRARVEQITAGVTDPDDQLQADIDNFHAGCALNKALLRARVMESSVTSVRHPSMRAEVVLAVQSLADPAYQQRVWIRREYPQDNFFDDFTQNVNILFDDTGVLPDPTSAVGDILHGNEVDAMIALGNVLNPLIDELGNADDAQYLDHPQWSHVVRAAQAASTVLNANAQ